MVVGLRRCQVLGGLFSARAYAALNANFWNLGPSLDDPEERSDDEFEILGKVGFQIKIFWVFKVTWMPS